ncbi:MAG: methanogenesis marker protein Mmp4/MtxX [Candidatus Hodarchaeota archaeon]
MTIIEFFKSKAKNKNSNIGIGLGGSKEHDIKILKAILRFLEEYNSTIFIFGNEKAINHIKKSKFYENTNKRIELIKSNEPEKDIFKFLKNNKINVIVRGNLSSSKFLKNMKDILKISDINRLALMETHKGFQFFYGPVGIDECNNIKRKILFVNKAILELENLNIVPKISILSGGRLGDIGRDPIVDKSINIATKVVDLLKKENPDLEINHDEILIENAIWNKSNVIIAPDGISGNLIYRTLVHLGGGNAYGAIYMGLDEVIIDTSRVGKLSEIHGALILALALAP